LQCLSCILGNMVGLSPASYEQRIRESWIWTELHKVRNIRPSFNTSLGMFGGLLYTGTLWYLTQGREPWTLSMHANHGALLCFTDLQWIHCLRRQPNSWLLLRLNHFWLMSDMLRPVHVNATQRDWTQLNFCRYECSCNCNELNSTDISSRSLLRPRSATQQPTAL